MEGPRVKGSTENPLDKRGLCLLSLDGGGVRGLSSLRILQGLMGRVNNERRVAGLSAVKPCELFDLIGGTSTGGLIAIMLGRLEMDVDQCITEYSRMIQQIFRKKSLPVSWKGRIKGRFDTSNLTHCLQETMASQGLSSTELLDDGKERQCRVFVCATAFETKSITRLKSYRLPADPNLTPTIVDAARATSAATSFFEPAIIGTRKYVDGALGANNPVDEVWNEAQNIWCAEDGALEPLVKCFVSIGTGSPGTFPMNEAILKVLAKDMVKMATQTERTAELFQARHRGLCDQKRYFRFNVAQGLQAVGLEEYKKEGLLEAATDDYLTSTDQKFRLRDCVQHLKEKTGQSPIDIATLIQGYDEASRKRKTDASTNIRFTDPAFVQNANFIGRDSDISSIHQFFTTARDKKQQGRVCIWGPGGVGKTQLATAYALAHKQQYSDILKVSARSLEALQEDFSNIIYEVSPHSSLSCAPGKSSSNAGVDQALIQENIRAVHWWFSDHPTGDWLLIMDDVSQEGVDILKFIPRTDTGDILITSQSREIGGYGHLITLGDLNPEDAVRLLLNKANIKDDEARSQTHSRATEIVKCLGYRALAVEHAGALIGCKGIQYYWQTFNHDRTMVLEQPEATSIHHESVLVTFRMSFTVLMQKNFSAAMFLTFLGYLDNMMISEDLLFENGKRRKSLDHFTMFETRLDFLKGVADLHALALIYYFEKDDGIVLSVHPLVHHLSVARLKDDQRLIWTTRMAYFLLSPIIYPTATETFLNHSSFKHLLRVLQQAMALSVDPLQKDRNLRLWSYVAQLTAHYYPYWHVSGKVGDLVAVFKRAISVLEYSTEQYHYTAWGYAAVVLTQAFEFTLSSESSYAIFKTFLGKQLKPTIASALDYATVVDKSQTVSDHMKLPRISFGPITLRRILTRDAPDYFLLKYAIYLREAAWLCMRRKSWNEGLLLSTLAELPVSLFDRQYTARFDLSPSQVVKAAFVAFTRRDIQAFLKILERFSQGSDENLAMAALYDLGKIKAKRGEHAEAEIIARKLTAYYPSGSDVAIASIKGTFYTWSYKALATALAGQGKLAEAQSILTDVYNTVQKSLEDNDTNLGQFHATYLIISFHKRWGISMPKDISEYRKEATAAFRRIYAPDKLRLLKEEALATGRMLLEQGALGEAFYIIQEWVSVTTEVLGLEHAVAQRAVLLLGIATSEAEQDAENVRSGDFWIHFGCLTFRRDVSIGFGNGHINSAAVAAAESEEKQITWQEAARWKLNLKRGRLYGSVYGFKTRTVLFGMGASLLLLVLWAFIVLKLHPSGSFILKTLCMILVTTLAVDIGGGFEVSTGWFIRLTHRRSQSRETEGYEITRYRI
ncbi:hypothetical protein AJ79_04916 [Helicocarpus griseus UAMH5409]|uniref:Lysophospholipase NTE1 n=1 Tax=Helicocarpus griseus UAMH5409 TaxID=1447875 RepID=A0A2B7XR48_9EURO|nr:hypothetical protein AJ79_04916 [Helicocarpus griseus UAMH5409]